MGIIEFWLKVIFTNRKSKQAINLSFSTADRASSTKHPTTNKSCAGRTRDASANNVVLLTVFL